MEHANVAVFEEDPETPDALELIDELSDSLQSVTGRSGRASFNAADVREPRAMFVVARDESGRALGCGAFRPMCSDIAEVKRMYARVRGKGIGGAVLACLESKARALGYEALWLETGVENIEAVSFYERKGYTRIPNFGIYAGKDNSVCFEKRLQ